MCNADSSDIQPHLLQTHSVFIFHKVKGIDKITLPTCILLRLRTDTLEQASGDAHKKRHIGIVKEESLIFVLSLSWDGPLQSKLAIFIACLPISNFYSVYFNCWLLLGPGLRCLRVFAFLCDYCDLCMEFATCPETQL